MTLGETVRLRTCGTCGVGTIRQLADGQALVEFADRTTWVDLSTVEPA